RDRREPRGHTRPGAARGVVGAGATPADRGTGAAAHPDRDADRSSMAGRQRGRNPRPRARRVRVVAGRRRSMAGRGRRAVAAGGRAAHAVMRAVTFGRLEAASFFHSAVYVSLLICAFVLGSPQPETFILGMAHGLLWIGMSLVCLAAARARIIPL